MKKEFFKYVSRNVAGMLGISAYIFADTFFISVAGGTNGITVLNLVLPLFGLIFAIGMMVAVGAATSFAIKKAQQDDQVDGYFTHSILWQLILSLPFILLGIISPESWLIWMGGDHQIVEIGIPYVRIILLGSPFFMVNNCFTSFIRNDNGPTLAMTASLCSSLFNIVFDYVFMFPMGLGLTGAALATIVSPVLSMIICSKHFKNKNCSIRFRKCRPSISLIINQGKLGVSAFVGEISSAVITTVFNTLLLMISGNIGVAAYGITANLAIVANTLLNGVAQGMQPLLSRSYGQRKYQEVRELMILGFIVTLLLEGIIVSVAWIGTDQLVAVFNSEKNQILAELAYEALRLYVLGYLVSGINMVLITYFASIGNAVCASIASVSRGLISVVVCAIVMASVWGLNGIWLSFLAAEVITFMIILLISQKNRKEAAA